MSDDDDKKIKPQDLQKGGRFSKGQSGNPKGRPKKVKPEADGRSIFGELPSDKLWREAFARLVTAKTPDGLKTMSFGEAVVSQYQNAAIKGNRIAMERVLDKKREFELADAKRAEEISDILRRKKADGEALLEATIDENVLVQLENLQTHPAVAAALAKDDLRLHGWVYDIASGEVFAYDYETAQYLPLGDIRPQADAPPPRVTDVASGDTRFRGRG